MKRLIEQQFQGDAALNYNPAHGTVKTEWQSGEPCLWANGEVPRKDGYRFQPSDFSDNDRIHHSPQGQEKAGRQLMYFFKTDPATRTWFVR